MLWYIMVYLHVWRMPLLVLISGAGTYFALGKRTSLQYLGERFKRLFIPLLVGVFTLVPVQVYIEKSAQFSSLLNYYPHMFEGVYPEGNFSWHHLWFIAYLFFIALVISPFLKFLRSGRFDLFVGKLARVVSKRMGANVFILPLIISQLVLRPFYPENTHGLFDDWAEVSCFILFFLSGYIIISNSRIVDSIRRQRRLFLFESVVSSIVLVTVPYMLSDTAGNLLWDIIEPVVAFSTGLATIGYAREYLVHDNKIRKLANEAIYPFYLLHQPVIVVVASYMVKWNIPVAEKVVIITMASFALTVAIYWFLVRPFNAMRLIFGLKMIRKQGRPEKAVLAPISVEVNTAEKSLNQ